MNRYRYLIMLLSYHRLYVYMGFFVIGDVISYLELDIFFAVAILALCLFIIRIKFIQAMLLMGFLISGINITSSVSSPPASDISKYIGETKNIKLMILADDGSNGNYIARCISVEEGVCGGKFLFVNNDKEKKLLYGDTLSIRGKVTPIDSFTQGLFDYGRYLANRHIFSKVLVEEYNLEPSVGGNLLIRYIHTFRMYLYKRIKFLYKEPNASLVGGLLIGKIITIDEHLKVIMKNSGTTHIAVVSGFNITVIMALVIRLFSNISRILKIVLITVIVSAFVVLTGADPPIIRAAFMGILPLFVLFFGRKVNTVLLLYLSAFMMIAYDPLVLYDLGFQLSFMATFSILVIANRFIQLFKLIPNFISEIFASTLSAYILVSPLIAFNFGKVNLAGILSNILILPLLPYIMLFSSLSLILPLSIYSYNIFYYATDILTSFEIRVMEIFASFDFSFDIDSNGFGILGVYIIIIGILFNLSFNDYRKRIN